MTRKRFIVVLGLVFLIGTGFLLFQNWRWLAVEEASRLAIQAGMEEQQKAHLTSPLPGDEILQNYAQESARPEEDLNALFHAVSNLMLLVKGDSPFRMGANEEFAAALRGKNRDQLRFVSDKSQIFNSQGQVIDRWDTPLYFHTLAHDRIDIRSAGPDRKMWTEDDLHRHYDGTFLKGAELNPASLSEEASPRR